MCADIEKSVFLKCVLQAEKSVYKHKNTVHVLAGLTAEKRKQLGIRS